MKATPDEIERVARDNLRRMIADAEATCHADTDPVWLGPDFALTVGDLRAIAAMDHERLPEPATGETEAERQLRNHQEQLDADGVMVGVSRQAVDEVLAQVASLRGQVAARDAVLKAIVAGARLGKELFEQRVHERKDRLTWWAVNVLQDNLACCGGAAEEALKEGPMT